MKYGMYVSVLAIVALGAYALPRMIPEQGEQLASETATYRNPELGLEFSYRSGPTGYVVQDIVSSSENNELLHTFVLIRSGDVGRAPEGGEGPPTITIHVLKNPQKQLPQTWADAHAQYSNIDLKIGDVVGAIVGGVRAIRYMADGLYVSENAVVAYGDNVYVFSGMFLDEDSDIRRDFEPLLNSVRFIPQAGQE